MPSGSRTAVVANAGSASCSREHGRAAGDRPRHRWDEDRGRGGRPHRPGATPSCRSPLRRGRGPSSSRRILLDLVRAAACGPRHRGHRGRRGRHRPLAGGPDAVGAEQRLPRLGDPRRAGARDGAAGRRRQRRERRRVRRGAAGRAALPADAVHHRRHRDRRRASCWTARSTAVRRAWAPSSDT